MPAIRLFQFLNDPAFQIQYRNSEQNLKQLCWVYHPLKKQLVLQDRVFQPFYQVEQ